MVAIGGCRRQGQGDDRRRRLKRTDISHFCRPTYLPSSGDYDCPPQPVMPEELPQPAAHLNHNRPQRLYFTIYSAVAPTICQGHYRARRQNPSSQPTIVSCYSEYAVNGYYSTETNYPRQIYAKITFNDRSHWEHAFGTVLKDGTADSGVRESILRVGTDRFVALLENDS